MKNSPIRNEDQTYTDEAWDISEKVVKFTQQLLNDHPNVHPDHIMSIINSSAFCEVTIAIALSSK